MGTEIGRKGDIRCARNLQRNHALLLELGLEPTGLFSDEKVGAGSCGQCGW